MTDDTNNKHERPKCPKCGSKLVEDPTPGGGELLIEEECVGCGMVYISDA